MALLKRINAVILGIITMISLGLILNVLFSDNESLGQSRRRSELVSNQYDTDDESDYLHEDDAVVLDDTELDEDSTDETNHDDSSIQEQPESNTEDQKNESQEEASKSQRENQMNSDELTENDQQDEQSNTSSQQHEQSEIDDNRSDEEHNDSQDQTDSQDAADEDVEEEEEIDYVSIIIDARQNGGSQYIGEIPYERGDTALDILLRFTQNRGISVSLSNEMANRSISEIDGHQISEIDGRWDLYINGYRSLHEAGANKITPNSTIRYHYNVNTTE